MKIKQEKNEGKERRFKDTATSLWLNSDHRIVLIGISLIGFYPNQDNGRTASRRANLSTQGRREKRKRIALEAQVKNPPDRSFEFDPSWSDLRL